MQTESINISSAEQDAWLPGQKAWPDARISRNDSATLNVSAAVMTAFQRRIHRCLCLLLLSVIFEGLARKLAPQTVGILIFFLKDFISFALLICLLSGKPNAEARNWLNVIGFLFVMLAPCFILTAIQDPLLAVFGIKQYALFPIVAVAMCAAYLPNHRKEFYLLIKLVSLSLVLTTSVAVLQNRLPASNWLNLSVAGEDLSGFSAGGYLRVSSTFPFVGQYCYYLNAICYCLPALFYLKQSPPNRLAILFGVALIGLFVIGTFVTGSRLAVVGNVAILSVGGLLLLCCGGTKALIKILCVVVLGALLLWVLQCQYPQFFAAYETRMGGDDAAEENSVLEQRVAGNLFDWTSGSTQAPPSFFGYGLGVMSNGSDKLSTYAARWRSNDFWTETDQATTLFEGGWYLVLTWYGFRLYIILYGLSVVLSLRNFEFQLIACFGWGFLVIVGITGTLAIQPPLAIWWWMAMGLILCLRHFDRGQITPAVIKRSW